MSGSRRRTFFDTGEAKPVPRIDPTRGLLTSVCDDPSCAYLHIEACCVLPGADGELRTSHEEGAKLWFDTASGAVGAVDPSDEPTAAWLQSLLDERLTGWLHARWHRHRDQRDGEAWRRHDWSDVRSGTLAGYADAFPGEWDTILRHEGKLYWVEDLYCVNPYCDCQNVHLVFAELGDDALVGIGYVTVSTVTWEVTESTAVMARTLWAAFLETNRLAVDQLPARRQRMREIGETLQRERLVMFDDGPLPPVWDALHPEPFRNTAAKVGRNEPCPCGSGRKYKRCCLGKLEAKAP